MHHTPLSATARQAAEMASKNLRDLDSDTSGDLIQRLRLFCLSRGAGGILELGRLFRRMDEDGAKNLTIEQFTLGLRELKLEISDEEIKDLFAKFGRLNMHEFLEQIRPPLSEGRKKIIGEVFDKIDKTGNGKITIADLKKVYNVNADPHYINGDESKESILNTFLENFEHDATKDGKITKEEFFHYYAGVSASIDNDGYFDLIMRQAYHL